jgi:MFS family permease
MADAAPRRKVAGSALTTPHFLLLFSAMLVAAAGNTALQSVMPAIGRAIGIADFWVAVAYTWSAVLWVLLAPYWAEKSDHHGRKALTLLGLGGFIVSMTLCGLVLVAGLHGWIAGATTFILFGLFRAIYGSLGCATPSATQAYLASRTRRAARTSALSALSSSFGLGTIVGPALAPLFVLPFVGLPGPLFAFALIGLVVAFAILWWLISGHAQAAGLTCIGFFVIDQLGLQPNGAEGPIAIVMMAGAAATLAAQWGLIPKLDLAPRALIVWGTAIATVGLLITMLASDLYGLVLGFGVASLGFGFTRPGFTAGASLAVPLAEQGAVAGVITSANGISYILAPSVGMLLYALDPHLPFGVAAAGLLVSLPWTLKRLR